MPSAIIYSPTELNPADLVQCVGQPFNEQKAFPVQVFREPLQSELDKYEYSLMILSKAAEKPEQFTLFGIPLDELYIALDSAQTILAVFVGLNNDNLVKKMEEAIGNEYMAMAFNSGDEEPVPSNYYWDYKDKCVSLKLRAHQKLFVTKLVPDNGFITFYNCEPSSYLDMPGPYAKRDELPVLSPALEKEKNRFLQLAYSFYPKGISDENELYGMTPQFKNLRETLQKRDYLDEQWRQLLAILQERFDCLDIGYTDPIMRGYRIAIILKTPKRHYIVVNVSKLLPHYCFYTRSAREDLRVWQHGYFTFNDFIPSDQEVVNWVTEQIQLHFQGYTEFPPALPLVPIEDVDFEERGFLLSEKQYRPYAEPMTLFNAFFSSNMFY